MILAALALPDAAEAAPLNEVRKLTASDAQASDGFGFRVAVSGDTAIVGARFEDSSGFSSGAAYLFERNEGGADNWGEVKKLIASDAQTNDRFGYSVAINGNTVVVGAIFEATGGIDSGAAYVFERNEGGADNWGEVKKLTASDAQLFDEFGWSVAVSGDTFVVGARFEGARAEKAGAAYVFERDEGGANNWGEVKKLTASDAQAFDQFGFSISVSGDHITVGAPFEDEGSLEGGAVYVFQRNQGGADNWGELRKLIASDAGTKDHFAFSVAASGNITIVGAQDGDAGGISTGTAYIFHRNEGGADNWGELKKLTASDAQEFDHFGVSVAASGNTAVVGADGEDASGISSGAAYLYERNEGGLDNWGEVDKLTASDAQEFDRFGGSVAVSGDTTVVGADDEDAGGTNAGAAYVFQEPPSPPVGGLALESHMRALPLETDAADGLSWRLLVVIAASSAGAGGLVAVGGVAWFTRRANSV